MPSIQESVQLAVNILEYRGFTIDYTEPDEGNIYLASGPNVQSGDWVRVRYHPFLDFLNMDAVLAAGYTYVPLDKKNTYNNWNPKPLFYYAFNLAENYAMVCDIVAYDQYTYDLGGDRVIPIGYVQFTKYYSYYNPV